METRAPRACPQGPASRQDSGLWMKMDHAEIQEQETPKVTLPRHAVIPRYFGVMDDEGADDVFIPTRPPPHQSSTAPLRPAEGITLNYSSETGSNGPADATEAKSNPAGLDWHHGEERRTAGTVQSTEESMDTASPPAEPDQTSTEDLLMGTCHDPSGRHRQHDTRRSHEEPEDVVMWKEADPEDIDGVYENETHSDKDGEKRESEDISAHTGSDSDSATNQEEETQTPAEVTNEDEEHVSSLNYKEHVSSLNYNPTESESERMALQHQFSEDWEDTMTKGEEGDGSKRVVNDIQQGEDLLQRLQLVQNRQDGHGSEVVSNRRGEEDFPANETNESKDGDRGRIDFSTMPEHPEEQKITEADLSDEDLSLSWVSADLSSINPQEEPQIQIQEEAPQGRQNLQRAGGLFSLTDNPDVLEIPFRSISLDRIEWQFSEQKMQKEIRQETQRELVLVNQGKIPGGYSKGDVRLLKETKLIFEAFQQENPEGPARNRKLPTATHVYPSVLERTRSLEMFSVQSFPVSKAQSLRLYECVTSERDTCPETLRAKSPTGASRDKTRLSPYPKPDKHPRQYRSTDSMTDTGLESPVLQRNPFFRLRPALARQPEVEKDIRQAKEREEELRRQRSALYGEEGAETREEDQARFTKGRVPDIRQSRGKLERIWPPPSKKDQLKSEQAQQEPKVHRAGGHRAPLWQRWESGQINAPPKEND